jgi:hypothetical protein
MLRALTSLSRFGALRAEGRRRWRTDRPPSLGEVQEQVHAEEDALRQARAAVVSKARGLPPASIRQLLIEELVTHGRDRPFDEVLDRQVSHIQATVPPGATFREGIIALARAYRNQRASASELRSSLQHPQMISGPHGQAPYLVLAGRSLPMAQVQVDQEAMQRWVLIPPRYWYRCSTTQEMARSRWLRT